MTNHHDSDITAEFWGNAPAWRTTGSTPVVRHRDAPAIPTAERGDPTGPARRDPTGPVRRTRTHGAASDRGFEAGSGDDRPGEIAGLRAHVDVPVDRATGPSIGAVDPFLVRIAVIVVVGVLLVPLAMALRSDPPPDTVPVTGTVASGGLGLGTARAVPQERVDAAPTALATPAALAAPAAAAPSPAGGAMPTPAAPAPARAAAPAHTPTTTAAPSCAGSYTVHRGDYWLRLAAAAGVRLGVLLAANSATIDTPLYPGDDICVPPGATMPTPPPTTSTTSTAPPAPSIARPTSGGASSGSSGSTGSASRPTTPAPTTAPPSTTTTTSAPRSVASTESAEQVRAIIREIWPDDLEERALLIAERESRFRPGAYNGHCCYGVFQIHWSAHRGWLAGHGVTSSGQLLDARTNVRMAYEIYLRAGSWGPWRQTAY